MSKPDFLKKRFSSLKGKTLENALAQRIAQEFPRIGGPRIQRLCAQMILEVIHNHIRRRESLSHGQIIWMAIDTQRPPARHQRLAESHLVPVVLDLVTAQDVDEIIARVPAGQRLLHRAVRLCHQAHDQGGLLANSDLAVLLSQNDARIAHLLAEHEKKTGQIVPRRATLHDVGTAISHKRIICYKHYVEGKSPDVVARETYHSLEAVDRYLAHYDRVRHCRLEGLSPEETAHILNCTVRLVRQYLEIDQEVSRD